ncbi:MAG: hypothetical protein WA269_11000 [Candidatus Udaeobacter sp.]
MAEEVEKVCPDLVIRDVEGKAFRVRYDAVNAMLLNEFLEEHRKVEEQQATVTQLKSELAMQRKEMKALTAHLKERDSKIEKVSAQIRSTKSTTPITFNAH